MSVCVPRKQATIAHGVSTKAVAGTPASLDTRPLASGCPGGPPSPRTIRHDHAATKM